MADDWQTGDLALCVDGHPCPCGCGKTGPMAGQVLVVESTMLAKSGYCLPTTLSRLMAGHTTPSASVKSAPTRPTQRT